VYDFGAIDINYFSTAMAPALKDSKWHRGIRGDWDAATDAAGISLA
jgi:hypothetical protein